VAELFYDDAADPSVIQGREVAVIGHGSFAGNRIAEYNAGLPKDNEYKKADEDHLLETTGKKLRKLMSWADEEAS
jgi:ketol-acid reductoisomerase